MDISSAIDLLQNVPAGALSGLGGILVREAWDLLRGGDPAVESAVRALPNNSSETDVVRAVIGTISIRGGNGGTGFVASAGSRVVAHGGSGAPGFVARGGDGGPAICPHCGKALR